LKLATYSCFGLGVLSLSLVAGIDPAAAQSGAPIPAIHMTAVGGAHQIFEQGVDTPSIQVAASGLNSSDAAVKGSLSCFDLWGKPVKWSQRITVGSAPISVPFDPGVGFYKIEGDFVVDGEHVHSQTEVGIVSPHWSGVRPNSFFASNTSGMKQGEDLDFLEKIGMKVQRVHFNAQTTVAATPNGQPASVDFTNQDQQLGNLESHDSFVLPICGYSIANAVSKAGLDINMYGPPRDYDEFLSTWKLILQHYPGITTWEFWNEPWIYGWTWAADGAAYRDLQTRWCKMALSVNPNMRIIAGNSTMFVEDHMEPWPDSWKGLISGVSHHPYSFSCGADTMRAGDQQRGMDATHEVQMRMGLPYYYLTEGGTQYTTPTSAGVDPKATDQPDQYDNNENAYKVVQYYVHAALTGAYQSNVQWEIGYGPTWTRADATYATMTHFLEDRPIAADIWPSNELIWGAVFANPSQITAAVRALPRADELSARWNVPVPESRQNDATKVAVIWAETGKSNDRVDEDGTLTISDPSGIVAYDCTGRVIPAGKNGLTVPFGEYPVYLTSESLDVVGLKDKIAHAAIGRVTPVNLYALSLSKPASEKQTLSVRVENQLNRTVSGTLVVRIAGVGKSSETPFTIEAGKLAEVTASWPGVATASPVNQYLATISAKTDAGTVTRSQAIAAAYFAHKTIKNDGDWQGVTPVVVDSSEAANGVDLSQYLLNPNLDKPAETASSARIVLKVYTAYDEDNIYIRAAVQQPTFQTTSGTPVVKGDKNIVLPYENGEPGGLGHPRYGGDCFQFAFGFRDRVSGWGRQMDDPYAWKGHFYDTDYEFLAQKSSHGDQLFQEWGPDTPRATAYQTENFDWFKEEPGTSIEIDRDEASHVTNYNIVIPRSQMPMFDPSRNRCRFGFILPNSSKLGPNSALRWSDAAGVFDYWRSAGSFTPTWEQALPCQTFFGIQPQ